MLLSQLLKSYETNDYQNRKGNYPKPNIPVSIQVSDHNHNVYMEFSFKSTSEVEAKNFMESFFKKIFKSAYNTIYIELDSYQDGDYYNDWVVGLAKLVDKDI